MWLNDSRSTGNRKTFKRDLKVFSIRQKWDKRNLEADVASCVNGVKRIDFFVQKHCICPK